MRRRVGMLTIAALLCAGAARADVRTEEKSQVKFEGGLGRMLTLFGGKAARDGVVNTVTVKGDRKATTSDAVGQIIDLQEEKIYDLDLKSRTYTVTTFADLRRRMDEARRKAAEQAPRESPSAPSGDSARNVEVDFSLKDTGQTRAVNGFDAREVLMTIVVREKGKTLQENGGMVVTSNIWLTPAIAAMQDVAEFDKKYAQKLAGPSMLDAQQMAAVVGMYPMMREAMARMQAESVNMSGTPVMTRTIFETVGTPDRKAVKEEKPEAKAPSGLGGLGGRFARRVIEGDKDKKGAAASAPASTDESRITVMSFQHDLLKVSATVADTDLAIPAGFKQK